MQNSHLYTIPLQYLQETENTHIHYFDRHTNWISAFRSETIRPHTSYTSKHSLFHSKIDPIATKWLAPAMLLLSVWRQMCKAEKKKSM